MAIVRSHLIALVLLGAVAGRAVSAAAEPTLSQIETAAASLARRLHAVRCEVSDSDQPAKRFELFVDNDKFRANVREGDATVFEFAFNGQVQQRFIGQAALLDFGRERFLGVNPYGFLHPFALPYLWLLAGAETWELASLRRDDLWAKRFKTARLLKEADVEGQRCAVVQFDDPRREGFVYRVSFAQELDCYPIRWEGFVDAGAKLTSTATVLEWQKLAAEEVVVPFKVRYQDSGLDGVSRPTGRTISVVEGTLAINGPMDAAVFTLSKARATHVIDREEYWARANKAIAKRTNLPISQPLPGWWRLGIVVGNVVVILALVGLMICRARRKASLAGGS